MNRFWIIFCAAGLAVWHPAVAQDTGGGSDSGTGSTDTGTGTSGGSTITPEPTSGAGSTSSPLPSSTGATPPTGNNALSSGVPSGTSTVPNAAASAPTFNFLGGGGFAPKTISGGVGRFAQPPFRFTVSIAQGYDDNVFSAPDKQITVPEVKGTVTTFEKRDVQVFAGFRRNTTSGKLTPVFITEQISVPVQKEVVISPAVTGLPKQGSAVTNVRLGLQAQLLSPRTVFTLDGTLGALYYFDRPGGAPVDYTGSLGLTYLHKLTPRLTVTAQVDAVTQSQPDFSRVNGPSQQTTGNYISANTKLDLSYQLTPRTSAVATYLSNITQQSSGQGNFYQNVVSAQFRYLVTPRATLAVELREGVNSYTETPVQNSTNSFLLAGADINVTARLRASGRVGGELRSFNSGPTQTSPYLESTLSYIFIHGSSLEWNNRFGFEEGSTPDQRRQSYRTSLGLNQVITGHITGTAGLAYNRISTTSLSGNPGTQAIVEQQIQANIGLQYVMSRSLLFSLNYTLTELVSTIPTSEYSRNQVFLGVTYAF